jgi:hypothetical protein
MRMRQVTSLVGLGVIGTLPWTIGFSWLFYRLFVLAGSPAHPSKFVVWLGSCGLSFILGVVPGALVPLVSSGRIWASWLVFFLAFVGSLVAFAVAAGDVSLSTAHITSPGAWSFVAGTVAGALISSTGLKRGT